MSPRSRKTHKWIAHAASKYAISHSQTLNSIMIQKTKAIYHCNGPKSHVWSRSIAKLSTETPSMSMYGDSYMMRLANVVRQNVAVKGTGLCLNLICFFLGLERVVRPVVRRRCAFCRSSVRYVCLSVCLPSRSLIISHARTGGSAIGLSLSNLGGLSLTFHTSAC